MNTSSWKSALCSLLSALLLVVLISLLFINPVSAVCTDIGSDGIDDNIITIGTAGDSNCTVDGTDDQVQIQQALNNATSGDTVKFVTATTYLLNSPGAGVTLLSLTTGGVTIDSVPGTLIKLADGEETGITMFDISGDNIRMYNISMDNNMWGQDNGEAGWADETKAITLGFDGDNNIMNNVIVRHTEGDCIEFSGNNLSISNVISGDVRHDTMVFYGVTSSTFTNITIEHNQTHSPNSGIRFFSANGVTFDNVNFVLNSTGGSGLILMGYEFYPTQDIYQQYNITIKNSHIRYSTWGLYFNGGSQSTASYKNNTKIYNTRFSNNDDGIYILNGWNYITLDGVTMIGNSNGIYDSSSGSSNLRVKNSVFLNNSGYGIYSNSTTLNLTYNNVWNNANNYQNATKAGTGSISTNPYLVSATDHHLKSEYNRWNGTAWVQDTVTSPSIGTGDPTTTIINCPSWGCPSVIEMGAYGNTLESSSPELLPTISFVDPTPENNSINTTGIVSINTSVTNATNGTSLLNWNRSLVGWWRMNEGAGGTLVEDFSGYGNNGTWYGNTTSNVTTGRFGNALDFDGSNDLIILPASIVPGTNKSITINAWLKSDRLAGDTSADFVWRSEPNGFYIKKYQSDDNKYYLYFVNSLAANVGTLYTPVDSSLGDWELHTVVYDDAIKRYKIYTNGNLVKNESSAGRYNLSIKYISYSSEAWNGSIDDVQIFNRVLSNNEINASYNAGLYRLNATFSNLSTGEYNYTAYVQDSLGAVNSTEKRYVTVSIPIPDTNTTPLISSVSNDTIGDTWSIINFTVNQSNANTSVHYGITTAITSSTSNLTTGTDRSVNLTGLLNGTKYYYSVFAWNSSNTSYWTNSTIQNFTTNSNVTTISAVTENRDMGWRTLIDENLSNNTPTSIFVSETTVPSNMQWLNNMSINSNANGLSINFTPLPFSNKVFLGQLYPSGHSLYHINFSLMSDVQTPDINIWFGKVGWVTVAYRPGYRYDVHLNHYNETGILTQPMFQVQLSDTTYFDMYAELNASNYFTIWNGKNTSQIMTTRFDLRRTEPYNYLSPTMIYFTVYKGAASYLNFTIYDFSQSIPKSLVTVLPNNNTFPFGFDGPRTNYSYGTDWLRDNGQTATLWIDEGIYNNTLNESQQADILDLIDNHSFELGIHFTTRLSSLSLDNANTTAENQLSNISGIFGTTPLSWCSLQNNDNSTHASIIWDTYSTLWRNDYTSINGWSNIANIYSDSPSTMGSNTTVFWNNASQHRTYVPAFTHSVLNPLLEKNSINSSEWDDIFGNYTSSGIEIIPYAKWYYTNNLTLTEISNVYFSSTDSYFNINTSGYNATTTIYDPNSEGIWFNNLSTIITTIDNSNETNLIINTPSNLTVQKLNLTITVSSDSIDVTPFVWNMTGNYTKIWNESSTNASITTYHEIGDFPISTEVYVKKNSLNWNNYTSNESGYINFTYDEGYSDIQFEISTEYTIDETIDQEIDISVVSNEWQDIIVNDTMTTSQFNACFGVTWLAYWNATSQKFESYKSGWAYHNTTVMAKGSGVLARFSTDKNISMTMNDSYNWSMLSGWNHIGIEVSKTLAQINTSVNTGCLVDEIGYTNLSTQTEYIFTCGSSGNASVTVHAGEAVWMNLTSGSIEKVRSW